MKKFLKSTKKLTLGNKKLYIWDKSVANGRFCWFALESSENRCLHLRDRQTSSAIPTDERLDVRLITPTLLQDAYKHYFKSEPGYKQPISSEPSVEYIVLFLFFFVTYEQNSFCCLVQYVIVNNTDLKCMLNVLKLISKTVILVNFDYEICGCVTDLGQFFSLPPEMGSNAFAFKCILNIFEKYLPLTNFSNTSQILFKQFEFFLFIFLVYQNSGLKSSKFGLISVTKLTVNQKMV